uniref:Lipocalin/cytosolic fatty-acid binding domain-containing protein n=1 Tax=Mandrillus leucophaeus TaxID=9568 RepID=A0A2K6ABW4_MANLE
MVVDKDFSEDRKPRKVSPVKVTALGGGDLEATFTFMREDRCQQGPGEPRKLIYVQELPGRDYFVFYCKDQRRGGLFHMGKLMGEGPAGPPHLQVGILTSTWRPWKNLRNSCSTRDSRRRTFSYPYRRVRGQLCPVPCVFPVLLTGTPGPCLGFLSLKSLNSGL